MRHAAPLRETLTTRRLVLVAILGYLAIRVATAAMLVVAAREQVVVRPWTDDDPDYFDLAVLWDGSWYRQIAEHGYPRTLPTDGAGNLQQNAWAFYPLFPLVSRGVMALTGLGFPVVASTLALLAGTAAAAVIAVLFARRTRPAIALVAVCVWAAAPSAPSLQIAYTESFAILLLALWIDALDRGRLGLLALLSILIGLTRPIAVPLGLVLLVVLVVRHRRGTGPTGRVHWGRALLALAATGVAGFIWPTVAWAGTGVRDAYTRTMGTWRSGGDIEPFTPWLGMSRWVFRDSPHADILGPVALTGLVLALIALVLGPWAERLGWELRAWCLAYPAYLGAVLDPFTSIYRYALPLFPLALVLVGGAWRRPARTPAAVALGLALVALGFWGQWTWITELLIFHPPSDYPP